MATQTDRYRVEIQPPSGFPHLNLGELLRYRYMVYLLTKRQITAVYRQSVLGPTWILLNSILATVLYTFVFNVVADIQTGDVPYPLFNFSAMAVWGLFTGALSSVTGSISNQPMIKKVYFPRLAIPLSHVLQKFVDFGLVFVVLVFLLVVYSFTPGAEAVFMPFFVLMAAAMGLGLGLLFAPFDVRSRDMSQIVGYLTRLWLYATPIVYPLEEVPQNIRFIAELNPMTTVVEGFRWTLLGGTPPSAAMLLWSVGFTLAVLWGGALYFKHAEKIFADIA